MKRSTAPALLLGLACTLASCLENEETITVRPDGSVHVVQRSSGDVSDLTEGYSIPLAPPWTPANENAELWLRFLGADTGSAAVQAAVDGLDWQATFGTPEKDGVDLVVEADFPSVEAWPRSAAPASDPYHSAYLQRSASLRVEDHGPRLVYTFERTYHARPFAGFDFGERLEEELSPEIRTKLENEQRLAADEVAKLAEILQNEHRELFAAFAREAVAMVYTHGSARLDPKTGERAVAAVEHAVGALFTPAFVDDLWNRVRAWSALSDEEKDNFGTNPLEALDTELRSRLRTAVRGSLQADRVPEDVLHEVLFGVEWNLVAYDHTMDLGDEEFTVAVEMPGRIVAGNHEELDGDGRAKWTLDAEDLRDRDAVLKVTSVVLK